MSALLPKGAAASVCSTTTSNKVLLPLEKTGVHQDQQQHLTNSCRNDDGSSSRIEVCGEVAHCSIFNICC